MKQEKIYCLFMIKTPEERNLESLKIFLEKGKQIIKNYLILWTLKIKASPLQWINEKDSQVPII